MKSKQFSPGILAAVFLLTFASVGRGASASGSNTGNVTIPDAGGYVSSTIAISSAPAGSVVTSIDVYFKCTHTFSGDLMVDLNADSTGSLGNRNLWNQEGGSADNPTRTTTGIATFNGLSVNRTWYLYAKDLAAGDSGYIDEWSITVYYEAPPTPPTLSSPGTSGSPGPTVANLTPTFSWGASAGATGYGLYIRDQTTGTLIYDNDNVPNGTSLALPAGYLVNGHEYRWNMRAKNASGFGAYTAGYLYFQTPTVVPDPPTLSSPGTSGSPGPTVANLTPTFSWGASAGATGYGLYIRDQTTGTLIYDNDSVPNGTSLALPAGYLVNGHEYRWNMRAKNASGFGAYTAGYLYFQTPTVVPDPPTLSSPGTSGSPGPTVANLTPTFSWGASAGATGYGLYIRDQTTGTLIYDNDNVPNGTSLALPAGYLVNGHEYRWNMRAKNASGFGAYTAGYLYFQTPTVVPDPPTLSSPGTSGSPGPTVANLTPTFSWGASAGATGYGLYIRDLTTGFLIYDNDSVPNGTSLALPAGYLVNGHEYRWNMRAKNASGFGAYTAGYLYFQAPNSSSAPIVQTTAATQQGTTTARLNATINPNGLNTTWYFQYGTTASYAQSTLSGAFGVGISTVQNVGYTIGGLAPNTLYHYRIVAFNGGGLVTGSDMTFQTLPLNQPDLIVENVTFSPSSVPAGNSFTINFRIRNQGTANCVATLARLRLSLDTHLTLSDQPLSPLNVSIPAITAGNYYDFSGTIAIPNTTPQGLYYVGIFADADNRTGQSDITNDGGISALRVTVTGGGATLPVIQAHPQNRNVTQGDTVSFSVTVGGTGPFSYQWKREGRPIYGETSSQLVLRNVSILQAGNYAVDVANAAGTVTSSNSLLTVSPLAPPTTQPLPGQCTIYGTIDPSLPTVVITHGWQPGETPALPSWVTNMAQAVSNRCFLATGQRVNVVCYYWQESFTDLVDLLGFPKALAATLNHGSDLAKQLKSILGESYDKKIQFIGHSLGTLVNAFAVSNLRNWNVEQFTILDAPLTAPLVDPWLFHRLLPSDRVKWVDNYYGTSVVFPAGAGDVIPGAAPSGGLALDQNHHGVHEFYRETITNAASSQGFYFSCLLTNFESRPHPDRWSPPPAPLLQGVLGVFDDRQELSWYVLENVGGLVQTGLYWIGNQLQNAIILNKPASGSPLIAKSGGSTPAGAGDPEPAEGDGIAEVSAAIDLVIPPDAQYLSFKFLCINAGPGDWLTATFNDNLLMSFRADSFTGTNFQTATMSVSNYAGQAGQLVVKLNSGGTAASEFVIGDFSFFAGSAPVFSNLRVFNGAFQFDLHGVVGSNYVVQVSTNLINWSSMSTSTIPTERSITITNPINGQPKQFYRVVAP